MLSTGMRYTRILQPMLIAATFIAVLHWVGENYVIPKSTFYMNEFKGEYIRKSIKRTTMRDIQFFVNDHEKIYAQHFQQRDSCLLYTSPSPRD